MRSRPKASGPPARALAASVSATAARSWSSLGTGRPRAAAERTSRARCRVRANGTPSTTLQVSKTPSPTVIPWSSAGTRAVDAVPRTPSTQTVVAIPPPCPIRRPRGTGAACHLRRTVPPRAPSPRRSGPERPRRHSAESLLPVGLGLAASAKVQDAPEGSAGPRRHADVAQLVEHHLAKVRVAGSNPVVRSETTHLPGGAVTELAVEWPRGEATACKAVYTGSNPVSTSTLAAPPRRAGTGD